MFAVEDIGDIVKAQNDVAADDQADTTCQEQVSAADYDPSLDRREDEEKRIRGVIVKDAAHKEGEAVEAIDVGDDGEEVEEEDDDVEDMFALGDTPKKKTKRKVKKVVVSETGLTGSATTDLLF
jgi:serine/threonine-protein kinase PRP4